ncbi:MAG: hypothetical protein AzoDbin1_04239 [Azoarcus sp.]|nr:hypothetical protein [Azoarcus sp.]
MPTAPKTLGQLAYERDLERQPKYQDGGRRRTWNELSEVAQWSWNRNPSDR